MECNHFGPGTCPAPTKTAYKIRTTEICANDCKSFLHLFVTLINAVCCYIKRVTPSGYPLRSYGCASSRKCEPKQIVGVWQIYQTFATQCCIPHVVCKKVKNETVNRCSTMQSYNANGARAKSQTLTLALTLTSVKEVF